MRTITTLPLLCLAVAGCSALGLGTPPEVKAACAYLDTPDPTLEVPIDRYGLDQWRFDAAVGRAVNAVRCDQGLKPLGEDPALARAAAYHAGDMVVHEFFDHNSPVKGRHAPADRLTQTGTQFTRLAENLATLSVYSFDNRHFITRDAAKCQFSFTPDGPLIQPHTYAGAAKALVDAWMDSSGHRQNILNPDMTRAGAGAAVKHDPSICGELVAVLDFAG